MRRTAQQRLAASSRAVQKGAGSAPRSHRPDSWLLRGIVVLVHVLPPDVLARLPGERLKFLARPRAVVVLLRQALVFVNAEQDEHLLGPGIHEARRGSFGVFQR